MDAIKVITTNNLKILYYLKKKRKYFTLALRALRRSKQYRRITLKKRRFKRRRTCWSLVKHSQFWETDVKLFTEEQFINTFRVSRATFSYLVDRLKLVRKSNTYWRDAIPLQKRIAIALYALSSSTDYRRVGYLFGVGRTTVGGIVADVCKEIGKVFKCEIFDAYPPSETEVTEFITGFNQLGLP